jgi:hypothetical protein
VDGGVEGRRKGEEEMMGIECVEDEGVSVRPILISNFVGGSLAVAHQAMMRHCYIFSFFLNFCLKSKT